MTVDIRASVTCSLGTLISASISDDYIQGTGLIKCKGSCEISGLITPSIGTVVTFSYSKDGITRTVPRRLRVLSSFADPFRRTTKVELGCKLTYLQDVKERLDWSGLDDPQNADLEEADSKIVTVPIRAQSIASECCSKLGIAPSGLLLSNVFSIEEFDFSAGYVNILSDLLVSECMCGYMNASEVLEIFSLSVIGGSGPVLDTSRIIDVGSIGVGSLPGDAVTVSYSSLKLKVPDDEEVVCRLADEEEEDISTWGTDLVESSSPAQATIGYRRNGEGDLLFSTFNWLETSTEETYYKVYELLEPNYVWKPGGAPAKYIKRNLVRKRIITLGSGSAAIAGGYAQQRLANGFGFNSFDVYKQSEELFSYDAYGNERRRVLTTYGSLLYLYGGAGIDFVYENADGSKSVVSLGQETGYLEKIIVKTTRSGDTVKTVTKRYGPWAETIPGQQAIASAREDITSAGEAESFLSFAYGGLHLIDVTVNTSRTGSRDPEELPTEGEALTERLAEDSGDPDNGFSTESGAEIELASGSSFGTRRIELSMPYAPDDTFARKIVSTNPLRYCFFSVKSDAPSKAKAFGVTQNKLLHGNRNGMNVQTAPEYLPGAPFSAVTVQANGLSAQYRTNGTSWTMDSNGIVVSSDLLYMGAVGGTGDFWFPVAPGITTLPTTPPVVDTAPTQVIGTETSLGEDPETYLATNYPTAISGDGVFDEETNDFWTYDGADWSNVGPTPGPTITVTTVVPPWNETVPLTARLRTKVEVTSFAFALNVQTNVDSYGITTTFSVRSIPALIEVPSAAVAVAAVAPSIAIGGAAFVPAADIATAVVAPTISTGASIAPPLVLVDLAASAVPYVGVFATVIQPPAAAITTSALAPTVSITRIVEVGATDLSLAAQTPLINPAIDPYFANVSLLLHLDGSNGSTTFTDSSSNAQTVSTHTGAPTIATAQSKFGGASAVFTASNTDSLVINDAAMDLGSQSASWTVEQWIYVTSSASTIALWYNGTTTDITNSWGCYAEFSGSNFRVRASAVNSAFNTEFNAVPGSYTNALNTWYHVAVSYDATTLRVYIDGTLSASATSSGWGLTLDPPNTFYIGYNRRFTPAYMNGYIDEMRVTKGVARYTSNFTAPTAPYPDM